MPKQRSCVYLDSLVRVFEVSSYFDYFRKYTKNKSHTDATLMPLDRHLGDFLLLMKVNRNGQAKILTPEIEQAILGHRFCRKPWDTVFQICLYTGCRINEALSLNTEDITSTHITFRRENTKGQHKGRQVPIAPQISFNREERKYPCSELAFPSGTVNKPLTTRAADLVLRKICADLSIQGVSTHSFRRTALTRMHKAGVPLKSIQVISGHTNLANLQRYLEVTEDDLIYAINQIGQNNGNNETSNVG